MKLADHVRAHLRRMYELGAKHGLEDALPDAEPEVLEALLKKRMKSYDRASAATSETGRS